MHSQLNADNNRKCKREKLSTKKDAERERERGMGLRGIECNKVSNVNEATPE